MRKTRKHYSLHAGKRAPSRCPTRSEASCSNPCTVDPSLIIINFDRLVVVPKISHCAHIVLVQLISTMEVVLEGLVGDKLVYENPLTTLDAVPDE